VRLLLVAILLAADPSARAYACCCGSAESAGYFARECERVFIAKFVKREATGAGKDHFQVTKALKGKASGKLALTFAPEKACDWLPDAGASVLVFEKAGKLRVMGKEVTAPKVEAYLARKEDPVDAQKEIHAEALRQVKLAEKALAAGQPTEASELARGSLDLARTWNAIVVLGRLELAAGKVESAFLFLDELKQSFARHATVRAEILQQLQGMPELKKLDKDERWKKLERALTQTTRAVYYDQGTSVDLAGTKLSLPRGVWAFRTAPAELAATSGARAEWSGEFANGLAVFLKGAQLVAHVYGVAIPEGASAVYPASFHGGAHDPVADRPGDPATLSDYNGEAGAGSADGPIGWPQGPIARVYKSKQPMLGTLEAALDAKKVCRPRQAKHDGPCAASAEKLERLPAADGWAGLRWTTTLSYGDYIGEATWDFLERKLGGDHVLLVAVGREQKGEVAALRSHLAKALLTPP